MSSADFLRAHRFDFRSDQSPQPKGHSAHLTIDVTTGSRREAGEVPCFAATKNLVYPLAVI
jgi:hypothetical protein